MQLNLKGKPPHTATVTIKDADNRTVFTGKYEVTDTGLQLPISEAPEPGPIANPFDDLFVDPESQPAAWLKNNPSDGRAPLIRKIAEQPTGIWLGEWSGDVGAFVRKKLQQAAGKTPLFVVYYTPNRDDGSYSAGGAASESAYKTWLAQISQAMGSSKAVFILEPDLLPRGDGNIQARYDLVKHATSVLKPHGRVYLDIGHPYWLASEEAARRLHKAGIAQADGFSLNVSNFASDADCESYGRQISEHLAGARFVIDCSRNGKGVLGIDRQHAEWYINPRERALGRKPQEGSGLVDAYLWIKVPGESDGAKDGAPPAGTFMPDYAADLARRASW